MNNKEQRRTVLVVDDTPENIDVLNGVLCSKYRIKVAVNGEKAIKIATGRTQPDIILLDIMMPGMDGYEVIRHLKQNPVTSDIPVIFITGLSDRKDEQLGLELGAVDYVTKPISPAIVQERVKTHLELKEAREYLQQQNEILEEKVRQRTKQLSNVQDAVIMSMGSLAETRDPETGNHIRRTQNYVRLLAEELSDHPKFESFFTPEIVTMLYKSSPLHDIGKVGVPDHILLKPGKLTFEEFEEMKHHSVYGRDVIISAEKTMDDPDDNLLSFGREIAYSHHEKWDGSGYPQGLKGEEIPISARLMAIADVYDAMICRRVYKAPFPPEKAVAIILEGRGSHFDPDMVDVFDKISEEFRLIAKRYTSDEEEMVV